MLRKRAERALKELYDRTERILEPEITPALEGSCRGPVDESGCELQRMNSGVFQAEKRSMLINDSLQMKAESGTCNMCSAPFSSCMHRNLSVLVSKVECGFSDNICENKETDSCSFIGVDGLPPKSGSCDDQRHEASETSNLLSTSSSHDSYSENIESKATLRASAAYASEDVDITPKLSSRKTAADQPLPRKITSTCHSASDLRNGLFLHQDEDLHGVECHEDNVSCITGVRDANVPACDHNDDLDKKDTPCSSASTCDIFSKENEMEVLVDAHHGSHHHEIDASESKSRELNTCPRESSRKNSGASSVNDVFSQKSDLEEFSSAKIELSPKILSSHSSLQSAYVDCSPDSKDMEKYQTSQQQGEEPFECLMNDVKSSVGQLVSMSIDKQKSAELPNNEDGKSGQIRSDSSSMALKNHDSCFEKEPAMDSEKPSNEATKCSNYSKQFGKNDSLMEASNVQEPNVLHQLITEGQNSESDSGLDDVKVCDICGDAGVEELLAICSICSDGAEHTYCMRIKLEKIPEGEWFCEECQLKEDAEKKVDKSDSISGTPKTDNLKENCQNFGTNFNPKNLPKLDIEAIDTDVRGSTKGMQSPQKSGKMHADRQEVTSLNSKKNSEMAGGSVGTSSQRRNDVLFQESAFKSMDMGKVKKTSLAPSPKGQSANSSQAISCSHMSSSKTSKIPAQLHSPRGHLSKQLSFSNSNMQLKVRQVINNLPQKQKNMRGSVSSNCRKDGVVKMMTKSPSFKSVSSGRSSFESVNKTQSLNSPRADEPRGWKPVKKRNMMERKNSFILDCPVVSSSPSAGTSVPKVDLKTSQHNGNLSTKSEPDVLSTKKGFGNAKDLGHSEVKKQTSNIIKRYESCNSENQRPCQVVPREGSPANPTAIDRLCSDADLVLQRNVTQVRESSPREDKIKDSTHSSSSRQVSSSGSRVLRCHRCNEASHATQFCPIDKLRISALKPSADQILREGSNKSSPKPSADKSLSESSNKSTKWKDAIEAAKTRTHKGYKLPDQSECSVPSTEVCCEAASKDFQSNSNGPKSLPLEGTPDGQVILGSSDADFGRGEPVTDMQKVEHPEGTPDGQVILGSSDADFGRGEPVTDMQKVEHPVEALCLPKECDSNAILTNSDGSNANPSMKILPDESCLLLANPFKASVIPEHKYIWQGGFEVLRTGRLPESFYGVQAHLSTGASPKVLEVVSQFPCKLQLDEVPCLSLWPVSFQGVSPKEDNIDLFFFAKDIESYGRAYGKLLENMLKNNLALRGNINEVELLIFPSNKLPENCQRWNMLFFLWGVFRGRTDCVKVLPDLPKQPCQFKLSTDPLVQEISCPLFEASLSPKTNSHGSSDKKFSSSDRKPMVKAVESSTRVDFQPTSFGIEDRICNIQESSFLQNPLCQLAAESREPLGLTTSPFPVRCLSDSPGQLHSSLGTCPVPDLQMSGEDSCPALRREATYLVKSGSDIDGKTPVHVHATSVENLDGALPARSTHSISSYFGQGEGNRDGERMRGRERSMKDEGGKDNEQQDHLMEIDHLSCKSRPSRKRAYSPSREIVTRTSGEPSKSADEMMVWCEKANFISHETEQEYKKRSCSERHASSCSGDENTTSNLSIHSLLSGYANEQQHMDGFCNGIGVAENPRGAERYFFPVDLGPVRNVGSENFIHVLSSDNEDMSESSTTPDLELALGGKKKSSEKKVLPLLFHPVDRKSSQVKLTGPAADDEDDMAASLCLSLAFPGTEKKQAVNLRTEQLLPKRPCVNTSLLLFGGFSDT